MLAELTPSQALKKFQAKRDKTSVSKKHGGEYPRVTLAPEDIKMVQGEIFQCIVPDCQCNFETRSDLQNHYANNHSEPAVIKAKENFVRQAIPDATIQKLSQIKNSLLKTLRI